MASQIFTVLSALATAIHLPSGLKTELLVVSLCPLRVARTLPVAASQIFTVLSSLVETICLPSGLKTALLT